ncbi:hypothetical protein BH23CHL2_BH23CHL2_13160 [soil metagenome]
MWVVEQGYECQFVAGGDYSTDRRAHVRSLRTTQRPDVGVDLNAPGMILMGPPNEMIRQDMDIAWGSRSFWMLASGFMACCGFTIFFLTAHLVPLATDAGIPAQQAGIALGLTGGTSIIANLGIAAISDRITRKYVLAGLYAMRGVSILMRVSLSGVTMLLYPGAALRVLTGKCADCRGISHRSSTEG